LLTLQSEKECGLAVCWSCLLVYPLFGTAAETEITCWIKVTLLTLHVVLSTQDIIGRFSWPDTCPFSNLHKWELYMLQW